MPKIDLKVLNFPNNKSDGLTVSLPKDKIELVQLIKKEHKANNVIVIFDDNDGVSIASSFRDKLGLDTQQFLCDAVMRMSFERFTVFDGNEGKN